MRKHFLLVCKVLILLSVLSCSPKKEEDPEPEVSNKEDDDSGYAVFWTANQKLAQENIAIYLQPTGYDSDILLGKITQAYSSGPGCDALASDFVKYRAIPGTYKIKAVGLSGTKWDVASVIITRGGCYKLEYR